MNAVLDAIKARRAIRKFRPDMVEKEKIDAVIEAGLYAASGKGTQSPIIIAVTDKDFRDRLSVVNRDIGGWDAPFDPFYGAPVVLCVVVSEEFRTRVYDGSMCIGNMMLAASSLGLGSCWIHRAKEVFESEEGKALLKEWGIEGDYEGIGNCILGYPAENPAPKPRKPDYVYFVE